MLSLGPRVKTAYAIFLVGGNHQEHRVSNDPENHDHRLQEARWERDCGTCSTTWPSQPPLTLFPAKGPVSWGRDLPSKHGAQHCTWPPPCSVPFRGRFPHLSAISHVHGGTWMKYDNPVGLGVRGISSSRGHSNPTTGRWWAPESGCRLSKGLE